MSIAPVAYVSSPRLKDTEVKAKVGYLPFLSRSASSLGTAAHVKCFKKPENSFLTT